MPDMHAIQSAYPHLLPAEPMLSPHQADMHNVACFLQGSTEEIHLPVLLDGNTFVNASFFQDEAHVIPGLIGAEKPPVVIAAHHIIVRLASLFSLNHFTFSDQQLINLVLDHKDALQAGMLQALGDLDQDAVLYQIWCVNEFEFLMAILAEYHPDWL